MSRRLALAIVAAMVSATVSAQSTEPGEHRVAPSRVPPAFAKTAESEAPGVRLGAIYRSSDGGYRFAGRSVDGRAVSVRLDRSGALVGRRSVRDIAPSKVPKAVARAIQGEVAKGGDLAGYQPGRIALVDRYDAKSKDVSTFYEVDGETPAGRHPRFEVDADGANLRVSPDQHPGLSDLESREPVALGQIPDPVREGAGTVAPGIKFTKVDHCTSVGGAYSFFHIFGRVDGRRMVEIQAKPDGRPYVVAVEIPLRDVPAATNDLIRREAAKNPQLVGFRPTMARRRRQLDVGREQVALLGDDPEGSPLDVLVDTRGFVLVLPDVEEYLREEAGFVRPGARGDVATAPANVTKGFAVLAARYGIDHHWIDATEPLRAAVAEGRKEFRSNTLTDKANNRRQTLAVAYAVDGKVGLAEGRDDEAFALDVHQDPRTLAPVPPRGFAVLAARFHFEDRAEDVTGAIRSRILDGRLNVRPTDLHLPDPAPGEPKALAVAYSVDGRVGLYVQSQWRLTELPPDAGPVNSGPLIVKKVEFSRNPSSVAFTPDGTQVVVAVEDGTIRTIEAKTGREARRFDGFPAGWLPLALSGNGATVAVGGVDGAVRVVDAKEGRARALLRGHTEPILRVAIASNGKLVASTSGDKSVRVWDVAEGREVRRIEDAGRTFVGVRISADGRQVIAAGDDGSIRAWEIASGREVRRAKVDEDSFGDLATSKSGREAFAGSHKGRVARWVPAADAQPEVILVDTEAERAIAPMPDGQRVLIGDRAAAVLWDFRTGHPVARLEGHFDWVIGLAVAPGGKLAATCGVDRTLILWNVAPLAR